MNVMNALRILTAVGIMVFASSGTGIAQFQTLDQTPEGKAFIEKYVRAVNAKDIAQRKALLHPDVRGCITPATEAYHVDVMNAVFKFDIPAVYKAVIRPMSETDKTFARMEIATGKKLGINYPVARTHQLILNYDKGENKGATLITMLAKKGDDYYEVIACPTDKWVKAYTARKSNPDEAATYAARVAEVMKEFQKSQPLADKRKFAGDEYGILAWDEQEYWSNEWRLRTNATPATVEIIVDYGDGTEKVLVDSATLKGEGKSPLEFEFRVGRPQQASNSDGAPEIRVPIGFSRIGNGAAYGVADWVVLSAMNAEPVNEQKSSLTDKITGAAGEVPLITYKLSDQQPKQSAVIKVRYK